MIGRCEFIGLLGGALTALPLAARAQQVMQVVGFVRSGSPEADANVISAFRNGLSEQGFVQGRNVSIEYRWSEAATEAALNCVHVVGTFRPHSILWSRFRSFKRSRAI